MEGRMPSVAEARSALMQCGAVVAPALCAMLAALPALATKLRGPGERPLVEIVMVPQGPKGEAIERPMIAGGGEAFRDCHPGEPCPELVVVPSSQPHAKIGSPSEEPGRGGDEALQQVTISAFAIGRTEVTVAQYMRCVAAGACREPEWRDPRSPHNVESGTSAHYRGLGHTVTGFGQPVTGVSFDDAEAYARWLSTHTGQPYRLPSEAEWEYAARAGTAGPYWWGAKPRREGEAGANCAGCAAPWDGRGAAPADALAPNPWGLHNANGNVWEWVADSYCDSYAASPVDGSPRLSSACPERHPRGLRVLRGGSWLNPPQFARAASRLGQRPDFRSNAAGFRIARDIRVRTQ
jgi:formylglycine-generating enzyme required for sulfatase activity